MAETHRTYEDHCEWCRKRIINFERPPALIEVMVLPEGDYRRTSRICHECHQALQKLISRRGRRRRLLADMWPAYVAASGALGLALALPPAGHECHASELKLRQNPLSQTTKVGAVEDRPAITENHKHVAVGSLALKVLKHAPTYPVFVSPVPDEITKVFDSREGASPHEPL